VREAYYAQFLAANNLKTLPQDEPLGERAKELVWPACLYAQPVPGGIKTTVRPGDNAITIYTRLTGGGGNLAALERFFNRPPAALTNLKPKEVLVGAHATAPVTVVPKDGDAPTFLSLLQREARRDGPSAAMLREVQLPGEIVLGLPPPSVGQVASITRTCTRPSRPPYEAAAVEHAYQFAKGRAQSAPIRLLGTQADVVVVDNGFFGANPRSQPADPFAGSPFPSQYFKFDKRATIAQRIEIADEIWPINFSNNLQPDAVSGHGTHVTGLVLGGPDFASYRNKQKEPWAVLTIINIANGTGTLLKGSQTALQSLLNIDSAKRIVNLSIAHDGLAAPDIESAYARLFQNGLQNLFVVSAGNFRKDVSDHAVYPAALGGPSSGNVISVAALDGEGQLAPFSNFSNNAVDMAAPGCEIASWLANTAQPTLLSGTSQAAPLVTFTASLLRSLAAESEARALKFRLVASGDMLDEPEDQRRIAYRVRLNIAKALYWFDDYVRLSGAQVGEYLGEVRAVTGLRCDGDRPQESRRLTDLWAFKRDRQQQGWIFTGKSARRVHPACAQAGGGVGDLMFVSTHRIDAQTGEPLPNSLELRIPLAEVQDLVLKTQFGVH
jgi:hypothetical protein